MAIYRAERTVEGDELKKRKRGTRRAPENVPYIVDNLWEWGGLFEAGEWTLSPFELNDQHDEARIFHIR